MRDKLKEKHKKHDMVRLKAQINSEHTGVESGNSMSAAAAMNGGGGGGGGGDRAKDNFFDD
jgi:hypothetical protein